MNNYSNKKIISKKNPFLVNFLRSALVFLIILSVLFSYITISNIKKSKTEMYQSQVNLLAEDWETQVNQFEEICLRIRVTPQYQPSRVASDQYQAVLLLRDFEQYARYSVLTDQCFLYYRENSQFYLSSGYSTSIDFYAGNYAKETREEFISTLTESNAPSVLSTDSTVFFFLPMKFDSYADKADVVLGFNVNKNMLGNRFQLVSGGLTGSLLLYHNGILLYNNQNDNSEPAGRHMLNATTDDGQFVFCYYPNYDRSIQFSISPVQFLLLAVVFFLLFITALFYAQKTYRPVQNIAQKYGATSQETNDGICNNALDEIDNKLRYMRQHNIAMTLQLSEKQQIIRQQLLNDLLHGKLNYDLKPVMEQAMINLPGPYYYVASIQFESVEEHNVFFSHVQYEIEHLTVEENGIFIYTIARPEKNRIYAICSIQAEQQKREVDEFIKEIVNRSSFWGVIGLGNLYQDIHKISASWLESTDNIRNAIKDKDASLSEAWALSQLSNAKTQRFFFYLANGDQDKAYEEFENYMVFFGSNDVSFLMYQYMFTCFVSEFINVAITKGIALSNRNMALILSADKASAFYDAVIAMMQEYFEKFRQLQQHERQEVYCEICEYLQNHFMDYDISIEQIAEHFSVSTAVVREAIASKTKNKYKEHVIHLRIELAKKLLMTETLSISEICTQVGYGNVSHFVTLFKKKTGMSPTEYRQYHKKAE